MYKICSQFLIVLSCVMLMVVSLQVDYVMIGVHTYRNNRVHIYRHAGCAADESG